MTHAGRSGEHLRGWWRALRWPIDEERLRLNARREADLPPSVRGPSQLAGVGHHSCGATYGVMERCDFACTSCYLTHQANATPPLEEERVFRQLDQLRAYLGPRGKAQITSGEVTLLEREQLGRYIRYARSIGLDPMVMTHGQRLLDEPAYLEALVREDGLEKVSIHIDVTQRGRPGWQPDLREEDLHPLRERFVELIRQTRSRTGRPLQAAHTVTVTEQNLDDVAEVTRWVGEHADAFRLLSFQPVAEVGRTHDRDSSRLTLDEVWKRVCDGLGQPLNRDALHFGHRECNILALVVLLTCGRARTVFETARAGKRWDRSFLGRATRAAAAFTIRDRPLPEKILALLSLILRNPRLLIETPFYGIYRLWGLRGWLAEAAGQVLRGHLPRIRKLAIVVHNFMSERELDSAVGKERLAACTFRVPVADRMVPMCELNATALRQELNTELRERFPIVDTPSKKTQRSA